jgi:hypothetical protein
MNRKIRVTKEYDIETSECGEFCDPFCTRMKHCILTTKNWRANGCRYKRTEFCKRYEVKACQPTYEELEAEIAKRVPWEVLCENCRYRHLIGCRIKGEIHNIPRATKKYCKLTKAQTDD